jgi:hypothetical protein
MKNLYYMHFNDEWLSVMTTQNMLHYLKAAQSPNPDMPNTNRTLVQRNIIFMNEQSLLHAFWLSLFLVSFGFHL